MKHIRKFLDEVFTLNYYDELGRTVTRVNLKKVN